VARDPGKQEITKKKTWKIKTSVDVMTRDSKYMLNEVESEEGGGASAPDWQGTVLIVEFDDTQGSATPRDCRDSDAASPTRRAVGSFHRVTTCCCFMYSERVCKMNHQRTSRVLIKGRLWGNLNGYDVIALRPGT
jgi:hypothetical protein